MFLAGELRKTFQVLLKAIFVPATIIPKFTDIIELTDLTGPSSEIYLWHLVPPEHSFLLLSPALQFLQ